MQSMKLVVFLFLLVSCGRVEKGSHTLSDERSLTPAQNIAVEIERGRLPELTVKALDRLIATGSGLMRLHKFEIEAMRIEEGWKFHRVAFQIAGMGQMGDHAAIDWLLATGEILRQVLGDKLFVLYHLDDIILVAFAWPVAVSCEDAVDKAEYARHFVGSKKLEKFIGDAHGLAPVASFWLTIIACDIGAPAPYSLFCSPAATLVESAMFHIVAPLISGRVWRMACPIQ